MLKTGTQPQALSVKGHDITRGDLAHNIRRLAWPSLLNQFLSMAPPLYDALWLGRLATSARITMASVLMALSSASGAVIARYVGAKDRKRADRAALQALPLMVLASVALGAAGLMWTEPLLRLAGADAGVLPLAMRYARLLFAGLVAIELMPAVGRMLDGAGAPYIGLGMRLWSTGPLFLVEPLLVSWRGIEGAALALVLASAAGALWGLGVLVAGRAPVRVDMRRLRLDVPPMGRIARVALPAVLQYGTPNLAISLLTRLVSSYRAVTWAAWVVARRVLSFAHIPSAGLVRAVPAMVGQNLSARNPDRAAQAVRFVARAVAVKMVVILGALALLAPQVTARFDTWPPR
jgi:Na+-driven multidrug efflux pump